MTKKKKEPEYIPLGQQQIDLLKEILKELKKANKKNG